MDNSTQEVLQNPLYFKKKCQDALYESVMTKINQELQKTEAKSSVAKDNNEESDKNKSCCCPGWMGAIASLLLLSAYAGLIIWILDRLFGGKDVKCDWTTMFVSNNVTILLVVILILATLVMIMSGIYILKYVSYCHEVCKAESEKKNDSKKKSEPTMTEVMIKRIQDAVFNDIVEDAIKAFKDKK